jgi:two-component system, cell cycle response regulator
MLVNSAPTYYLLASAEPSLLTIFEAMLSTDGARVKIFLSADAALPALIAPQAPALALLDVNLPGMEMDQLLAKASGRNFPIVIIADTVSQKWFDRLAEGIIDDLIPRTIESSLLHLRIAAALRHHVQSRELECLRENAALKAQDAPLDPLTGVCNRPAILSRLFDETDCVRRMDGSLSIILFDIDDFGHWNERLGWEACDDLLCQVVKRTTRLLRSGALLGRIGEDEFIVALPGCSNENAQLMARRIRADVFSTPFCVGQNVIRLSACFGVAFNRSRAPVALRKAEQALRVAKITGPESIQCAGTWARPLAAPVAFLSPTSGNKLLAW